MDSSLSRLSDVLYLVEEAVGALESGESSLTSVAMKAGRIARCLEDFDYVEVFHREVTGYEGPLQEMTPDEWRLAGLADRCYIHESSEGEFETLAYLDPIEALEVGLQIARDRLAVINRTGATGNLAVGFEREALAAEVKQGLRRVAARRGLLHAYLSAACDQVKYSQITADAFERIREEVDLMMTKRLPNATQQFDSAYANLSSDNPEDWANAVHSCRRLLESLADELFPPAPPRSKNGREIKLESSNYKNRLVCYVEDHADSSTFAAVVGSSLTFLADRLDALFVAANKGTHTQMPQVEADRYVIYTYMVIGDILSL